MNGAPLAHYGVPIGPSVAPAEHGGLRIGGYRRECLKVLTKTSESAILALLYLHRKDSGTPVPPTQIAEDLGASSSYMAKVCALLTKAGLLRALRGVKGGVVLSRPVTEITLLEVVEACQGKILADYCQEADRIDWVCGFHHAMYELHRAFTGVLEQWTLSDIADKPAPAKQLLGKVHCRLGCLHRAQSHSASSVRKHTP